MFGENAYNDSNKKRRLLQTQPKALQIF